MNSKLAGDHEIYCCLYRVCWCGATCLSTFDKMLPGATCPSSVSPGKSHCDSGVMGVWGNCKSYDKRQSVVKDCVKLNSVNIVENAKWMPVTCAYRLIYEGKPLFDWHPLVSGDYKTVHQTGNSVKNSTFPEKHIPVSKWEEFITNQFSEKS